MLINKSIADFLAELKSNSPAPGGGSAAALAGAIGAALGIMVGHLTVSSAKYEAVHEESKKLISKLDERLRALEKYIDEDTEAFNKVMKAYKLPKGTEEEKGVRSGAIQDALKEASILPWQVANSCLEILKMSNRMLCIGNTNAASDAAVAGRLAQAAIWSAVYNVRINLSSIQDTYFVADMQKKVEEIIKSSEIELSQLIESANEKI